MSRETRARDADRAAACELIEAAFADGQLSPEEHDARVERALRAQTLDELDALTRDLQGDRPAVPVPRAPRRARLPRVRPVWLALVPIVGAIVFGLAVAVSTVGGGDLFTAEALDELVADAREDLGSTRVDDIIVFHEHAVLTRAQAGSPTRAERLSYRTTGGFDEFTVSKRDAGNAYVDLADVDTAAAVALLERAPELVRVKDSEPEHRHLRIESTDGGRLYIFITNEYNENGWVIAGLDGEVREVHPYEEG